MSLTPSRMLPLGHIAPPFTLLDTLSQKKLSLQELASPNGTVIMFICNHCPYVKHLEKQLVSFAARYQKNGVAFVAISANDPESYPQDGPEAMKTNGERLSFSFPYLYDETQEVAKAYQAACTPDFYLFDAQLACVYRGQFDDSRPGSDVPVTGESLGHAIDQLLAGRPINEQQKPSVGCNIKWKSVSK